MKVFTLIISLVFVVSCNSESKKTTNTAENQEKDSQTITAKDIEALDYTDYVLSPDSQNAVGDWQQYQELMDQIDYLKQGDLSFFDGKNELMNTFMLELKSDPPPSVMTPIIDARMVALETKLLKLHSTLKLSNVKKKLVLQDIKEFLVAVANLNLQINKKFELESQVIEDPTIKDKIK